MFLDAVCLKALYYLPEEKGFWMLIFFLKNRSQVNLSFTAAAVVILLVCMLNIDPYLPRISIVLLLISITETQMFGP